MVYINNEREIIAHNDFVTRSEYLSNYVNSANCFWVDKKMELPPPIQNKIALVYLNEENDDFIYSYVDCSEESPQKEPSLLELLGQQLSDLEIQQLEYNMQATQEREFLGQQLSDLEISILERGL